MKDREFSHPLLERLGTVAREELDGRDQAVRITAEVTPGQLAAHPRDELERLLARYTEGKLDATALGELRALAAADPHLARGLALFEPLGATELHGLADRLHATLAAEPGPARAVVAASRRRRGPTARGRATLVGAGLAVCVVGLWVHLGLRPQGAGRPGASRANGSSPLPDYTVHARGGLVALRGVAAESAGPSAQRLPPDGTLRVELRPDADVGERVDVAAFVVPLAQRDGGLVEAGPVEPISPQVESDSRSGAARVLAPVRRTFGARRGPWRLVLVLTRHDARDRLPFPEQLARDARSRGQDWVRAAVDLELVDGYPPPSGVGTNAQSK